MTENEKARCDEIVNRIKTLRTAVVCAYVIYAIAACAVIILFSFVLKDRTDIGGLLFLLIFVTAVALVITARRLTRKAYMRMWDLYTFECDPEAFISVYDRILTKKSLREAPVSILITRCFVAMLTGDFETAKKYAGELNQKMAYTYGLSVLAEISYQEGDRDAFFSLYDRYLEELKRPDVRADREDSDLLEAFYLQLSGQNEKALERALGTPIPEDIYLGITEHMEELDG